MDRWQRRLQRYAPRSCLCLCPDFDRGSVGDFGLATSSLAAVDPSDLSLHVSTDTDMTLGKYTELFDSLQFEA